MATTILVTGSAGFIGYHLVDLLSQIPDNKVIGIDSFVRGVNDDLYRALGDRSNVMLLKGTLTDARITRSLPDNIEIIYHLAALNGTQNFYERSFDVMKSCTLPTFSLWQRFGPWRRLQRFVYAGSCEAYASTVTRFDWEVPTGEDVPLCIDDVFNARWSYGASKLHGEVLTANAGRHFGIPVTILRYHNIYGPRMGNKHVIPDFLMRARHGSFELYGYEDTRAFMYVADAVEATVLAAQSPVLVNEIVNIGGEKETRILDLGTMMMRLGGFHGELALYPAPQGSVKRRAARLDKLRRATGFQEKWDLERGLRETIRYYLADIDHEPALSARVASR